MILTRNRLRMLILEEMGSPLVAEGITEFVNPFGTGRKALNKIMKGKYISDVKEGIDDIIVMWGGKDAINPESERHKEAMQKVSREISSTIRQLPAIVSTLKPLVPDEPQMHSSRISAAFQQMRDRSVPNIDAIARAVWDVVTDLYEVDALASAGITAGTFA